jgi:hypothetical protein
MSYTPPGKKVKFEFLSSYTAPSSPTKFQFYDIEFDLYEGVNPPKSPVSFDFGGGQPPAPIIGKLRAQLDDCLGVFGSNVVNPAIGSFDTKLDDATGVFVGKTVPTFGKFNTALDSCVGFFDARYDSNVKRSLIRGVNSRQETTKPARLNTAFLQSNAVKNVVSVSTWQDTTSQVSAAVVSVEQNTLKISTDKVSQQDSTLQIGAKTSFKHEQAVSLKSVLLSVVETATPLDAKTNADLQQLIPIGSRFEFASEDVNDATHVFNVSLNKQMPPEYWYTPAATFTLEMQPPSHIFSLVESSYQAVSPVAFNLVLADSNATNFNLGLIDVEVVTTIRTIFDSVSTYAPIPDFAYPFTDAKKGLTESVQRGGYRLSATATTKQAAPIGRKSCFKSESTKFLYSQRQPRAEGGGTIIDPPRPPLPPSNVATFIIPTKTVYQMQHTITATLIDFTPLNVDGISISLDADSWAWQFSCKLLDVDQLSLLVSTENTPVEIIITINGFEWRVLAEKTTHTKTFAKDEIGLSGHSLSALLAPPFLQPRSATQADLFTVQQLAELELPNGWTIDWQAPTWNVPAGAFSYTAKTPIQVISEIAADIGAIVIPSRNSRTLKIAPRYPVLPWQFAEATPNLIIPDSALQSLTYRAVIPAQANGVYIHGGEVGGVIGWCRLTGSDGGRLAQTVTNSLMTDAIGCRALGERILAGQFTQPSLQSLMLPMNSTDMPLANVGDLVRVNVGNSQVRGIVNSVSITANLKEVWQTLQIGEETTNVWSVFKQILPREPLLVGTLSSTDGKTSLITLIDGGVISVRGTGTAGAKYYVRAGRIENEAPNLEVNEIMI